MLKIPSFKKKTKNTEGGVNLAQDVSVETAPSTPVATGGTGGQATGPRTSVNTVQGPRQSVDRHRMPLMNKVPYLKVPDEPIVASTQEFLPLLDIVDDMVLFKDGGVAMILETTSLNFGLLSEEEQYAVISAYAAFINSLSFSIQILVRTQKKDISKYLEYLVDAAPKIQNVKLHGIMEGYIKFISETIKSKNVLEKKFYVIIPFSPYELGVSKSTVAGAFSKKTKLPYAKDYVMKKAEVALYPRRDHLVRQMSRLGLKLRQLTSEEIVKLYENTLEPDWEVLQSAEEENRNAKL